MSQRRGPPAEPLPPCQTLFLGSLRVGVEGKGWKKTLERAFGRFSARGKPRIRIVRNSFNHTVGYGWVENVLVEQAEAAAAALDGTLSVDGEIIAVSLCTDRRDALCPRLGRQARLQLALCEPHPPLEQPTAERIAELLQLFVGVGVGSAPAEPPPKATLIDASAGEGLGSAVFASAFSGVLAVEAEPQRHAALKANLGGSLASEGSRVSLHTTLDSALQQQVAGVRLGFFQPEPELSEPETEWILRRFRTLLGAGHDVVAALLPLSVDFPTVAAGLVQAPIAGASEDERPHPFRVEFTRPDYSGDDAPRAGVWKEWQLIVVTAAPLLAESGKSRLVFGNARLDSLVGVLLGFYAKYGKEHRPLFYDWEKQRAIQLTRWKGAKLAAEQGGLTLKELRAAQQPGPEPEPELAPEPEPEPEPEEKQTSGVGAVVSPHARACRLVWVLIVDGATCDRKAGTARKASWVGFDKGYRSRRDALARSVTAALWSQPASASDRAQLDGDDDSPRGVHGDCECHIIHEQTGELLSCGAEFASEWRRGGPPTEARLLAAFDDAARGRDVPGLSVDKDTTTVAEATARIFERARLQSGTAAVVELHEDKDRFLPVYSAQAGEAATELDALVLVLGCVQDHSDAVAMVVSTGASQPAVGGRHVAVNVGPVSEFSSKVIHLLQSHHDAQRLAPAVQAQLSQQPERPMAMPESAAAPLHFWVWCDGVAVAQLPTAEQCAAPNPSLTPAHRAAVWRIPSIVIAVFAKSHGAYSGVRLSLVLDDAVVNLDGSVITRHCTKRGWGALTEHHTLVCVRDAISADPATALCASFRAALAERPAAEAERFVLLENDAASKELPVLPLYTAQTRPQGMTDATHHMLILPERGAGCGEEVNGIIRELAPAAQVVRCRSAIGGTADPVRTAVALQAHHNCGVLAGAVEALLPTAGGV